MLTEVRQKFHAIDLPIRLATSPMEFSRRIRDRRADTLFMIDIRKRRGKVRPVEYFLIYCGRKARVRAIDVDRRHRQVLLDVMEPPSHLITNRWDRSRRLMVEEAVVVRAARRRILAGLDERHLFICPLKQRASSVREAHRKLAPDEVRKVSRFLEVKRQGEWFFVPVREPRELAVIEQAVADGSQRDDVGITAAGRPHRVQHLVEVGEESYALGTVRHPDHRTLKMKVWHRIHQNTEDVAVRPTGMTWVD